MLGAARLGQRHRRAAAAPAGLGHGDRGVSSTVGENEIKSHGAASCSHPQATESSALVWTKPKHFSDAGVLRVGRCRCAQGPQLTPQAWSLCHRGHMASASPVRDELIPLPGLRDALFFWGLCGGG